jgi:hypothetical protein
LGSWPFREGDVKSVASELSSPAALVLPFAGAVCAALGRLAAICCVIRLYGEGFDCRSWRNVSNTCANGESWPLSGSDEPKPLVLFEVAMANPARLRAGLMIDCKRCLRGQWELCSYPTIGISVPNFKVLATR